MFFKMKEKLRELKKEMEIPEGIDVEVEGNEIIVKRKGAELRKKFSKVKVEKEGNKIFVKTKKATKREKKKVNTVVAHIKNIFRGLQKRFVYKLQICFVHFPMNVSIKGEEVVIKNFLGETRERKAKIIPGAEVKIEREFVIVDSHDKEAAGQTASNIERATKIKGRDRRIFMDGIFIVEKSGRKI